MVEQGVVQHPGILVKEAMDCFGLGINAFARELQVSPPTVYRIVTGKSAISPEMALRLSIAVGNSPQLWLQRQAEYDLYCVQKQVDVSSLAQIKACATGKPALNGDRQELALASNGDVSLEQQVLAVFENRPCAEHTRRTYCRQANAFVRWCLANHGCMTLAQCRDHANAWLASRSHLSCFTQELDATVLAKLYGCERRQFVHSAGRRREDIKRSRTKCVRDRFFSEDKHRDFVAFCRGTGLKRAELKVLTGNQLRVTADGAYIEMPFSWKEGIRMVPIIGAVDGIVRMMQQAGVGRVFQKVYTGADIQSYRADYARALYAMHARDLKTCQQAPFPGEGNRLACSYRNSVYIPRGVGKGKWLDRLAMGIVTEALGLRNAMSFARSYLI